MTSQRNPYTGVTTLIDTFAGWLKHRRELNEMRRLDHAEFDRIAADLGISSGDLDELVRHGLHAADELPSLLKALGISEASLQSTQPLILRDMERVCALCTNKTECDRDLATGRAAEHYRVYCPNAPTIGGLGETAAP